MPRHADRKAFTRDLANTFRLPYRKVQNVLNAHRPPTDAEIEAAGRIPFGPAHGPAPTGRIMTHLLDVNGEGGGLDLYPLRVRAPWDDTSDAEGVLRMACRSDWFGSRRRPALVVEIRAFPPQLPPGAWSNALDFLLHDEGWNYDPHTWLETWRADLYPTAGRPSARARVHVHHPKTGLTLFDGPVVLPPVWLASTGIHPLGITVVAGPTGGAVMPDFLDHDDLLKELFDQGDLVAGVVPVRVTPLGHEPDQPAVRIGRTTGTETVR
ncbi:hypothetical protein ACIQF6_28425 [Kitasatospora sp. NPDC092948]|uniref:hypothetical protein n=1 Tax=Kitasatospora sp. NPDC092948 TaxID=3364088 RepID=UPI00381B448C